MALGPIVRVERFFDGTMRVAAMPQSASSTASAETLEAKVRTLAEEVLVGTTYFLVDLNVRGHKGTRVLEIYVDGDEDFGHDDIAVISKEIGFLLDVEDVVDGGYTLEVSSPGIKRPLGHRRQYQKNVGRTLRVRHEPAGEKETILVGELVRATDDAIELEEPSGERHTLAYDDINQARIELPW
jgi:ribosome maturation factor RimP